MRTDNIPIDNLKQPELSKKSHGSPVRSFTTTWFRGNLGFFYVHLTIVGPVLKQPEGYFPRGSSEAESVLETISNEVELLKKELR